MMTISASNVGERLPSAQREVSPAQQKGQYAGFQPRLSTPDLCQIGAWPDRGSANGDGGQQDQLLGST